MKLIRIHLYTRNLLDTNAIVSQLNYIAGKDNTAMPQAKNIGSAVKTDNSTVVVNMLDINKKQAIQALQNLIQLYACFQAKGDIQFIDPLTKNNIKLVSMPVPEEYMQETLDKLNNIYHLKLKAEDLC